MADAKTKSETTKVDSAAQAAAQPETVATEKVETTAAQAAAPTVATAVEGVESVSTEVKEAAAEVKDMVTVVVPKDFKLMVDHNTTHLFKAGVQEMERWIAEHWYAVANGVKVYVKEIEKKL